MEAVVRERKATFHAFSISLHTTAPRQFLDITDSISDYIRVSAIEQGIATIVSQHTTAAIVVNEHEPELLKDLDGFLLGLAPKEREYAHNAVPCLPGEYPNGHSHCQALLLNASASVPIADGALILGRYQRIFLVELDRARARSVSVAILSL